MGFESVFMCVPYRKKKKKRKRDSKFKFSGNAFLGVCFAFEIM